MEPFSEAVQAALSERRPDGIDEDVTGLKYLSNDARVRSASVYADHIDFTRMCLLLLILVLPDTRFY
jgi:hypothetical protein